MLALAEVHCANPVGKLLGMKDNETQQWKEGQVSDWTAALEEMVQFIPNWREYSEL